VDSGLLFSDSQQKIKTGMTVVAVGSQIQLLVSDGDF
jgi:hypothetical protein